MSKRKRGRMSDARFYHIEAAMVAFDGLPDEAFMAAMEDHGIDADDLAHYADEQERRNPAGKVIDLMQALKDSLKTPSQ